MRDNRRHVWCLTNDGGHMLKMQALLGSRCSQWQEGSCRLLQKRLPPLQTPAQMLRPLARQKLS